MRKSVRPRRLLVRNRHPERSEGSQYLPDRRLHSRAAQFSDGFSMWSITK